MRSLCSEAHAKRAEQIRLQIAAQTTATFQKTNFEPGSDEKLAVFADRWRWAQEHHVEPSLANPEDSPGDPGFGYKLTKGRNGRIVHKERVPIDQANAQRIAVEEIVSVLEQVRRVYGRSNAKP